MSYLTCQRSKFCQQNIVICFDKLLYLRYHYIIDTYLQQREKSMVPNAISFQILSEKCDLITVCDIMPASCFSPIWEGDKTSAGVRSQDWTFGPSKEISYLLKASTEDFHPGCSTSCILHSLIISDASHKCFHCLFINSSAYKSVLQKGIL